MSFLTSDNSTNFKTRQAETCPSYYEAILFTRIFQLSNGKPVSISLIVMH